nr:cation-transporting P-type ATPase [uncultured Tolumonas sp.]
MFIANLSVAEALDSLKTTEQGLTHAEAQRRLREFGYNRLEVVKQKSILLRFLGEFTHFFAIILWIAAGLAFFAETQAPNEGMLTLGIAILGVILINGIFSFWQEYRAERAISALTKLLPQQALVLRDGQLQPILAEMLVPGDCIVLEEGDNVPADCRLIYAAGVRVNISTVTGESLPMARVAETVADSSALNAKNLLLAGTSVVSGQCRAVIFATGRYTEFGQIAHLTQTEQGSISHLQLEIARLSKLVAGFAATLGIIFFGIGTLLGLPFWDNLMFAIGIIVANVPEGLLPTVTLSLAMATQRMAKRHALVRHLTAVETLGSTTVICSDKTGTLTQNKMTASRIYRLDQLNEIADHAAYASDIRLIQNAQYCHNLKKSFHGSQSIWLGDPMEIALADFGKQSHDFGDIPISSEIVFDSDRKRMSVVIEHAGERWLYCKGAPETVLPLCKQVVSQTENDEQIIPIDHAVQRQITAAQNTMANDGLRVLAFAYRRLDAEQLPEERDLIFSALIGLHDPPRPEVKEAMMRCHSAGIKVIMVTGDHPHTAVAIAREIGLVTSANPVVLEGQVLRKMSAAHLQLVLDSPEIIFARVTAEQKMHVVKALKRKNEIVAVTGDGVNDAPALKIADIGIAMGVSGTDVAKEASDIILLDDNFASIVNAIEEGRTVFENIRKFLTYILTSNIPELLPYIAFVIFKIPLPLTIIQILAVDLGTDMLPALALGAESSDKKLMQQPPRPAKERLLSWPLLIRAYLWLGMLEAFASLTVFFFVLHQSGWEYGDLLSKTDLFYQQATTACLAAIVMAQIMNLFVCRHPHMSVFQLKISGNPLLWLGIAVEIALILLVVYTPWGNALFGTQPLALSVWSLMMVLALCFGCLEELRKWIVRRM